MAGSILKLQLEWRKDLVLTYICLGGLSFILRSFPSIFPCWEQGYNLPVLRDQCLDLIFGSLPLHFFVIAFFIVILCVGLWCGFSYSVLLASPVSLGKPVINADSLAPNRNLWEGATGKLTFKISYIFGENYMFQTLKMFWRMCCKEFPSGPCFPNTHFPFSEVCTIMLVSYIFFLKFFFVHRQLNTCVYSSPLSLLHKL